MWAAKGGRTAWHSAFDNYGRHPFPRNADQGSSLRVPNIGRVGAKALFVNKSADETPQGWYCACCSAPEPPMPHIHVPLCPMSPCQDRNRFLDSHRMAGGAMQGQLPKNQSHVLISPPPTSPIVMRLEHEGSALGLLVTTKLEVLAPLERELLLGLA
jgi:hypothetical protein